MSERLSTLNIKYAPTLFIVCLLFTGAFQAAWAQEPILRINAGSSSEVTFEGTTFIGDTYFSTSTIGPVLSRGISDTENDELYQTERLTADNETDFSYEIPVPSSGMYSINLHFAETAFEQVGQRVFDVVVEGTTALNDYDIIEAAGDNNTARVEEISGIVVTDGALTLEFNAITERAKVNGIEIFGSTTEIEVPFLLNVGGFEFVSTTDTWMEDDDTFFLEGTELQISEPISGTISDEIYQSERFGSDVDPLRFLLTGVPAGNYSIELHFSENFHDSQGARVFDVFIEGENVLDDFDIFAEAGGKYVAYFESFQNISVSDGILNITLEPIQGSTTINAIAITELSPVSNEDEAALPDEYILSSAYPNPFNPSTQFTLSMAQTQKVTIQVFNILGQRVATLHEGLLTGNSHHTFTFETVDQPSGMYLIQVAGEHFVETQQVVLLK